MTMPTRRFLTTAIAAALACVVGCASALNYDDPAGPILVAQQPSSRLATSDIRLVTFNLKFGEHVDRAADLLTRPGPLKDADVLFLQEMDGPGTEALARALGMNSVYVPSAQHPSSHRDFGVAILSPWPLDDVRKVPLPHEHRYRNLRRAAVVATVRTPAGLVRAYSVHFETAFGLSEGRRRDQARAVLTDAMRWSGPAVIAGDFNGRAPADEVMMAGFTWLTQTLTDRGRFFDFDHVLVRGLCATGKPPAAHARDAGRASDHRPVWAVVRPCEVS